MPFDQSKCAFRIFFFHTPGGTRGPGGPGGGPLRSLSHVGEFEPLSERGPPLRSISAWPLGGSPGPRDTGQESSKEERRGKANKMTMMKGLM